MTIPARKPATFGCLFHHDTMTGGRVVAVPRVHTSRKSFPRFVRGHCLSLLETPAERLRHRGSKCRLHEDASPSSFDGMGPDPTVHILATDRLHVNIVVFRRSKYPLTRKGVASA